MYKIYADDVCIYDDVSVNDSLKLVDPVLTLEENVAGSLTFTMSSANPGFASIRRMTTELIVKKRDKEIWAGRVVDEKTDFFNRRKLVCEGELAYLNDTSQSPHDFGGVTPRQFLEYILNRHNAKVAADKRFSVGIVTLSGVVDFVTDYEKTIECINEQLIKKLEAKVRVRRENGVRYIDCFDREDNINTNSQVITFGENLLDFTKSFDMTELATVILPLGAELEEPPEGSLEIYTDVSSVNGGSIYVPSSAAVERFGWVEKVIHWDDVKSPASLLLRAQNYLRSEQFDEMKLVVHAFDLNYISENSEDIKLLDEVRVISQPHGLDKMFPVTKLTIPLDNPENAVFEFGTESGQSLTQVNNETNADILNRINNIPSPSSILRSAQDNASQLIQNATNGYVTILNSGTETQEILITNDPDYTAATKVWRWNINGLGYSSTGYNGSYELAMTMDGHIVADMITAGTMLADRIFGGQLTLGGVDDEGGVFVLKDGSNRSAIIMNHDGIRMVASNRFYMALTPDGQITGGTYSGSLSDMTALRTANNYTEYGTFDASATIHDSDSGNDWHGFEIKTNLLHLVAAHVATTDSMASGAVSTTVVGRAEIPYISDIRDNTDGSISWDTRYLGVVNGLITHY